MSRNWNVFLKSLLFAFLGFLLGIVSTIIYLAVDFDMDNLNFTPIITVVISFIVTIILYQQYKINKDDLRLALYEKRFKIYQSVVDLLSDALINENVSKEELSKFIVNTNESAFLFDAEIPEYINSIRENSLQLQILNRKLASNLPIDDERTKLTNEKDELFIWFSNQFHQLNELFSKYLSFKTIS